MTASKQVVRKSFLHASWSERLACIRIERKRALERVQSRVQAYWDRQWEKRLIASLMGVLYSNVANNGGRHGERHSCTCRNRDAARNQYHGSGQCIQWPAVINTALTLGDRLSDMQAIAMHSAIYGEALKNERNSVLQAVGQQSADSDLQGHGCDCG